ncbi:hypothetical protein [Sagittula salina]|uniref:Uncharacterized protein n=1 Tax=Sagittula salina TaxID=2820268 RepID=A0A940MI67_9RHOB|nr:hypothetical protein [Sagittula salina]MBP0481961.1 hypothetical protein [Sagittula salina]
MSGVWDFILSPAGIALYAGFWVFKIVAGAWLLSRAVAMLPGRARIWAEEKLIRLRLLKRPTGPL